MRHPQVSNYTNSNRAPSRRRLSFASLPSLSPPAAAAAPPPPPPPRLLLLLPLVLMATTPALRGRCGCGGGEGGSSRSSPLIVLIPRSRGRRRRRVVVAAAPALAPPPRGRQGVERRPVAALASSSQHRPRLSRGGQGGGRVAHRAQLAQQPKPARGRRRREREAPHGGAQRDRQDGAPRARVDAVGAQALAGLLVGDGRGDGGACFVWLKGGGGRRSAASASAARRRGALALAHYLPDPSAAPPSSSTCRGLTERGPVPGLSSAASSSRRPEEGAISASGLTRCARAPPSFVSGREPSSSESCLLGWT